MAFPIAMRKTYEGKSVEWQQFLQDSKFTQQNKELYFGGLESIGFGRTQVFLTAHKFDNSPVTNQ
jgi:CRISPR-associated protein Cmr4